MIKHKIVLPAPENCLSHCSLRIQHITRCLYSLAAFDRKIEVILDDGTYEKLVPPRQRTPNTGMPNGNGKYACFFWVNNNLFMIIDADDPSMNHECWTKYYEEKGVKAFFILCNRKSMQFIFDDCNVPTFSLTCWPPWNIPNDYLEQAYARDYNKPKDINVMFRGKVKHNKIHRKKWMNIVRNEISHTYIVDTSDPINGLLDGYKYVDYISRSKIVWCPKTVVFGQYTENVCTSREIEAMGVGSLVVRLPVGIIERVPRVAGKHYVEVQEDCSDLIEKLKYYLEHDDERKEIIHNAKLFYDLHCSPLARAKQIFEDCLGVTKTDWYKNSI